MEAIQSRVELWIRDQKAKIMKVSWGPLQWRMRWPPPWSSTEQREQRKRIKLEYERRRKQLRDLCRALQAESVPDLQDILCCMVLSECVYKRPAAELVRAVNKFKVDFGGHIVSLERVQPSADHVPHRYLLAEAGDTLFASFVGTKQYKDVMADANILQGVIFHDDMEDTEESEAADSEYIDGYKPPIQNSSKSLEAKTKQPRDRPKPAAHRGFMARAKGIPALELYRLAQKKKRKLVLCGHSLGGAVAALATLAILRVISASSSSKENDKVPVKCITFSQPPVGNAALRDYVNTKGWHQYFKSYCIPEDVVPRILSPAYFHHYNAQIPLSPVGTEIGLSNKSVVKGESGIEKKKDTEGEQLVLGLGPVQNSFWRLSKLVPLEGVRRQINKYRGKQVDSTEVSGSRSTVLEEEAIEPQSLEIQEGSDGISLKPISDLGNKPSDITLAGKSTEKTQKDGDRRRWRRVPYLPSYVPFGQLYLLGNSSVELLSGSEYSKLTSVKSVIAELRERFQSHSMKSYRSRFQRIYELCMGTSIFPGLEQLQQFPNLQQWLGLAVAGTVELGHIVEAPNIRSATSVVPLGWSGTVEKNGEPFKVDIAGLGLHLCTLVHAQVNGTWCSTTVESFPSPPSYSSNHGDQEELQKMRVLVGPPLKRPPYHQIVADSLLPAFSTINKEPTKVSSMQNSNSSNERNFRHPDDPIDLYIFCTSDFTTVPSEVHLRTRRVRLLGLEGAGKTSLFKAITGQGKIPVIANIESLLPDPDVQEGIAGGICYSDSFGVNLQELSSEVSRFRDELWMGIRDLSRKTDLIVLVHNLSHKIPQYSGPDGSEKKPALALMLDEAKALGIPWVLAITNKFSVSAHQQKAAIEAVVQGYRASPSSAEVLNSCPYVIPGAATASLSWAAGSSEEKTGPQKLILAPMNIVRMPFQRKDTVFPIEGVNSLRQLMHSVLRNHEEASLEELARDRLVSELARDRASALDGGRDSQAKASLSAATVGASVGAGLGLVLAVVMGAASALRKP